MLLFDWTNWSTWAGTSSTEVMVEGMIAAMIDNERLQLKNNVLQEETKLGQDVRANVETKYWEFD